MFKQHSQKQLLPIPFLVVLVLTSGACLGGKPGGTQPRDLASLSTVVDPEGMCPSAGLCPDDRGPYIDGSEGVRSVVAENSGYQFMSSYRPYTPTRTVNIDLSKPAGENGDNPFTYSGLLPLHLAIMWNIWNPGVFADGPVPGPMGGSFTLSGTTYQLRFGSSDEWRASDVSVSRSADVWEVESIYPHKVRLFRLGKKGVAVDLGLYYVPFKLELTDLTATQVSAQTSAAPEDIFSWSPRGDRIALAASDPGGDHTIQVIDLQTGSVLGEYGSGAFASAPRGLAWANRGEMLALSANTSDGLEIVFVLNLKTGSLVEIGLGSTPRWAPDDSRLIFISGEGINIFDLNRGSVVTIERTGLD